MKVTKQYNMINRLQEMVENLKEIQDAVRNKQKTIEFSELEWISPLTFLPLVVRANKNGIRIEYSGEDSSIMSYLNTIYFPSGTDDLSSSDKTYLPITRIKCGTSNNLLNEYEERMINKIICRYRNPFINALKFLTSELQTNVEEHSKMSEYWIFAQYWEKIRTCEICIADTGIGYKKSYEGTPYEVREDSDAIMNAKNGISSKKIEERGAGIPGIMKIFIDGFGGELIIMSGDALLYLCQENPIIYKCPVKWHGSIISLRFKLKDIHVHDYY